MVWLVWFQWRFGAREQSPGSERLHCVQPFCVGGWTDLADRGLYSTAGEEVGHNRVVFGRCRWLSGNNTRCRFRPAMVLPDFRRRRWVLL